VTALALLLGGVLSSSDSAARPPAAIPSALVADRSLSGFAAGDTAALLAQLEEDVRASPRDADSLTLLGLAYQQRARETANPDYYTKSESALRRALALAPRDVTAIGGLASLALSRHRFREGLALGRRARALSPDNARNYGVIGDALLELGRYPTAFAAFDTMNRLKPNLAAYARISYARELLGNRAGALQAMELALDSARGQREPLAWAHVELGKLRLSHGQVRAAGREFRLALRALPGYAYALDRLAHVEQALGRPKRALALSGRAVETVPLPEFVTTLGDLHAAQGNRGLAREQYALIGAIERLLTANGVRTDLETALFNLDHGIRPRESLARARQARADRPSIVGDDVLAWALERNGRCTEALRFSKRALRLGTKDALMFFHRGMIERCLGRQPDAQRWFQRALRQNPHFSLIWAPVARRALA